MADLRWNVPVKARLWLKWSRLQYNGSIIKLINPIFYGPVLADCLKLENSGYIYLDLTKHFITLIPQPYIVKYAWNGINKQTTEEVKFKEAYLEDNLGHLTKLSNNDSILLDCTKHTTEDESNGVFLSSFQALVYKENSEPYEFFK